MKPIQTNKIVKRLYPFLPPQYHNRWFLYDARYDFAQEYIADTTLENPYGTLPNSITAWDSEIEKVIEEYAAIELSPYGINFSMLRKQLEQGGYMYGQLLAMEFLWRAVEYVKRTWYDVSVPMSSPGYTWTKANIVMQFLNDPTIYQTIYSRKIKDRNLFKTLTTYAEPTLTSPEYMNGDKKLPIRVSIEVKGKYKHYEGFPPVLKYDDVDDGETSWHQVNMYPTT